MSSFHSLKRTDFTGTDEQWTELMGLAAFTSKINGVEYLSGEAVEIEDAVALAADKKPYGNVPYADPGYQKDGKKRYPLDTESHVRSAHSYFSKPENYNRYTPAQRAKIRARIRGAWKRLIDPKGPPSDQE